MTDERVERRAAEALPEERSAGVEDPEALAAAVLAESDERQADGAAAPSQGRGRALPARA